MQNSAVRKFFFSALVAITLLGLCSYASAYIPYEVTATKSLKAISKDIQSSPDSGTFKVFFGSYSKVDQFKLDGVTVGIDSLIFQRKEGTESDSTIRVDSTLFDIKRVGGTVVLRGLSFQLTNSKAILIAGAETGKENHHLIIDSCFIQADTLGGTFISWLALNSSTIDIRRSFFVTKGQRSDTRISLNAGTVLLSNNLFNFPGAIAVTTTGKIEARSNTINRTQFQFTGTFSGALPTYLFSQNLVAHHPLVDAFNSTDFWLVYPSGFDAVNSSVKYNHIYSTWKGFDYPANAQWSIGGVTNQTIDTLPGKPSTRLWDWYVAADTLTGFANGQLARKEKYDVFPGDTASSWTLKTAAASVFYKSALFPRQFKAEFDATQPAPTAANPDLRFMNPTSGPLHFGSFRVDSVSVAVQARDGNPVLLARDSIGTYIPQPPITRVPGLTSVFTNSLASARYFFLSYFGNTRSGTDVTPSGVLGKDDTLKFLKVDSAGYTSMFVDGSGTFPNDTRFLLRNVHYQTTAVLKDSVIFGLRDSIPAYQPDSIRWMIAGTPNRYLPALRVPGTTGRFYAKAAAENPFNAFLVEKLSVPKDGTSIPIAAGSVLAPSQNGYQLAIDSFPAPDTLHYGHPSKAYRFRTAGRGDGDSLTLKLKPGAEQEAFSDSLGVIKLTGKTDSLGNINVSLAKADTLKGYFLAVKYNILKDTLYSAFVNGGATLQGFRSAASGKLRLAALPDTVRDYPIANRDTVFGNTLYLAGKSLIKTWVVPDTSFNMTFAAAGAHNRANAEAWWSDGKAWAQIAKPAAGFFSAPDTVNVRIPAVPESALYVIVVERLLPPETYVSSVPNYNSVNGTFSVIVTYKGDTLNKAITAYCVEVRTVDQYGNVDAPACVPKSIGAGSVVTINPNFIYAYRIQYFTGALRYGSPSFQTLDGPSWVPDLVLPPAARLRSKRRWHLVGLPFNGTLGKALAERKDIPLDSNAIDTIKVMKVVTGNQLDYLKNWKDSSFTSGRAYLVAGARPFDLEVDPATKFEPLKEFRMGLDTGWHLLANPFPTTLAAAKIRSTATLGTFFALNVDSGGAKNIYSWDTATTLFAFNGYAYHSNKAEELIFDLLADTSVAKPAAKAASLPALVKVDLKSLDASSHMYLSTSANGDIPFLPAPSASLELRLGGGSGFMVKSVPEFQAIDEPVEIRSLEEGQAAFTLGLSREAAAAMDWKMNLIDLGSGKIYDEAAASRLPIAQGSHAYRLVAGSSAFVAGRVETFLAGAPAEIGLSQNFPNPARGLTRIILDWPAAQTQDRHAFLQVLDIRGREIRKIALDHIEVGKQVLTLDASAWSPGIYLYRLTVVTGGQRMRLQKRMLVSP